MLDTRFAPIGASRGNWRDANATVPESKALFQGCASRNNRMYAAVSSISDKSVSRPAVAFRFTE